MHTQIKNQKITNTQQWNVFYKKCSTDLKCVVNQNTGNLTKELQKEILKRAVIYSDKDKAKNFKPYIVSPKVGKGD